MGGEYNRKDRLYWDAKEHGYRSRAAFKLIEINEKFRLLGQGSRVFDLGAWPGGWLQVAAQLVGAQGRVVGIDLVQIEPLPSENVLLLHGDARDEALVTTAADFAGGRFDVLLSDMSPKLTGIKEADRYAAVACAELAMFIAERVLTPGGALVVKVFKSPESDAFVKTVRPLFNKVARVELDSTRKTSNEYYLIATGYKGALG